jgi:signal transduction histidine kinase
MSINNITQQERENQLKRQLTQNISHELKTPVSSIQGYMETIIANPNLDAEKLRFFIERSYHQSIRLTQLLQDISLLSKLDEATTLFERETEYVNEIITDVLNDVSLEIDSKNITIENHINQIIIIKGNHSILYSVFRNLIDNSISHAGQHFTISLQMLPGRRRKLLFFLYDTGVGVPEEHFPRLVRPFLPSRYRQISKNGWNRNLGLAIVKNGILISSWKNNCSQQKRRRFGISFQFKKRPIRHFIEYICGKKFIKNSIFKYCIT